MKHLPVTYCVICYSNIGGGEDDQRLLNSEPLPKLLDAQLNVIFTLTNLYLFKSKQLENCLRKWGDPVNWVRLCKTCERDVYSIRSVFERLSEIQREFDNKKHVLLEKIRTQVDSLSSQEKLMLGRRNQEILIECRRIVHENLKWKKMVTSTRPPVITLNPFDGDRIARQLASNSKTELRLLKFENVIERVKVEREASPIPEEFSFDMNELATDVFQDQIESKIIQKTVSGGRISEDEDPDFEVNFAPEGIDSDSDFEPPSDTKFKLSSPKARKRCRRLKRCIDSEDDVSNSGKKLKISSEIEESDKAEDDFPVRKRRIRAYRGQRKIFCPYCNTEFRVGPYLTYSRHLQSCSETHQDSTPDLKCTLCTKKWSCSSGNNKEYLEHVVVCKEKLKTPPVPWRHSIIKCNLCEDSCYLPFPEYPSHIYVCHQYRHGCTQCPFRSQNSNAVSVVHWGKKHPDLSDTPMSRRVESRPDGIPCILPDIPWWCPASECLQQFKDEHSRDMHLQSCQVFQEDQSLQRSLKCATCDREYFSEEELLIHNVSAHGCRKKPKSTIKPLITIPSNKTETVGMKLEARTEIAEEEIMPENDSPLPNEIEGKKDPRRIRCPYCYALYRVGPFLSFSKHLQTCSQSLSESTPELKCSLCKGNWSCPPKNVQEYLEHTLACWEYLKTPPLPWRHSVIKCNLCEDSCYLPFPEYPTHVHMIHQLRHKCTQCSFRSPKANYISVNHWNRMHGHLLDSTPMENRVESIPDGVTLPLPDIPWWCPALECLQKFDDEASRDQHSGSCQAFQDQSPQRSFKCSICKKEYFSEEEVIIHRVCMHGYLVSPGTKVRDAVPSQAKFGKSHKCSLCGKQYWNQYSLRKHVVRCRTHRLKFPSKEKGEEQKGQVHGDGSFPEDNEPSNDNYELDLTKVTLANDRQGGSCNLCGRSLKTISKLKVHMRYVHEGYRDTGTMCSICGIQLKRRSYMPTHMRNAHPHDFDTGHRCKVCNKPFINARALQNHLLKAKHSDPAESKNKVERGPFKCTYPSCKRIFQKAGRLKNHVKMHEEQSVQENICDLCGKTFTKRPAMMQHIKRYHHGQLLFKCEICGKGSQSQSLFLHHKAAIHSIGDYKCDVDGCSKVFSKEKLLEKHKKHTHEGLEKPKPYQCSFCGKGFNRIPKLKEHEQAIHSSDRDNKPFQCRLCGSSFALKKYLDYHVTYTHMKKGRNKVQKKELWQGKVDIADEGS